MALPYCSENNSRSSFSKFVTYQFIAISAVLAVCGCAKPLAYNMVTTEGQKIVTVADSPQVISAKQTLVQIAAEEHLGNPKAKSLLFSARVLNLSGVPITVSWENISASFDDKPLEVVDSGKVFKVRGGNSLLAPLIQGASTALAATGFGDALTAMQFSNLHNTVDAQETVKDKSAEGILSSYLFPGLIAHEEKRFGTFLVKIPKKKVPGMWKITLRLPEINEEHVFLFEVFRPET